MKTMFVKTALWPLLLGVCTLVTITSCKKDEDKTPEKLETQLLGTWDIKSFKVDGYEYMGTLVEEATIQFDKQKNFEQRVSFKDEPEEVIEGNYTVDETKKEIAMDDGTETVTVKVVLSDGKNLELHTTQEGLAVVLKAVRKE